MGGITESEGDLQSLLDERKLLLQDGRGVVAAVAATEGLVS